MGAFNSIDGIGYYNPEGKLVKHEPCEHSRIQEYKFVSRNDKTTFEPGDECYLIHTEWISIWIDWVKRIKPLPGPITNQIVVEASQTRAVKPKRDFKVLSKIVWEFLFSRYGGGPVLLLEVPGRFRIDQYQDNSWVRFLRFDHDIILIIPSSYPEPPQQYDSSTDVHQYVPRSSSLTTWENSRQGDQEQDPGLTDDPGNTEIDGERPSMSFFNIFSSISMSTPSQLNGTANGSDGNAAGGPRVAHVIGDGGIDSLENTVSYDKIFIGSSSSQGQGHTSNIGTDNELHYVDSPLYSSTDAAGNINSTTHGSLPAGTIEESNHYEGTEADSTAGPSLFETLTDLIYPPRVGHHSPLRRPLLETQGIEPDSGSENEMRHEYVCPTTASRSASTTATTNHIIEELSQQQENTNVDSEPTTR